MKIHNKLEIKTKDKCYVSYNNLLLPFAEALMLGEGYSSYLAIGSGVTQTDPFHLAKFESVVELVSDAHNYNLLNGQLFLRKKWILDENDDTPYEIVEVGLTANIEKDNPRIANRFLVNGGAPIYRDAGEEMTFEITIYLDFENSSNFKLTAGENKLVGFLLGEKKEGDFFVARGYDDTSNDIIIERNEPGADKQLVVPTILVEDEPPRVNFSFSGELSAGGVSEFLLFIGDSVVARQNVENVYGGTSAVSVEITADNDGMLTIDIPDVEEVVSVKNLTTGEMVESFELKQYGTSFKSSLEEILSDCVVDDNTKIITSVQKDKIAILNGSTARIFALSEDGAIDELVATNIDVSDGYLYVIYDKIFLVKCRHADDTYSMRYYYYHPTKLSYIKYSCGLNSGACPGVTTTDPCTDMRAFTMDSERNSGAMMVVIVTDNCIFGYRTRVAPSYGLASSDVMYVSGYNCKNVACMEPTNYYSNILASYDYKGDRLIYRRNNLFYPYSDSWATSIVRDYLSEGYPKVAKNYIYAVDNDIATIKLLYVDDLSNKSIVFEGAEKIYTDDALDYVIVKYSSGLYKIYYVDASLKLYEFISPLPNLGGEIKEYYVLSGYMVFRLSNNKIVRIKIDKSKFIVSMIPKGDVAEVSIMADTTPGQDGNNVKYKAGIYVSAVDE